MYRNLSADSGTLSQGDYDYIVIGGGIVGACTAYELKLKHPEKSIAILEANTVSSQTSRSSSKMLHGGIRYLETLDFALVFEALREKNFWIKAKPEVSKEAPFYLPVYRSSKYPLWAMKLAVFLYNLLSLFKNKKYPHLSKEEFLTTFPTMKSDGLRGAATYSDAIIDDEGFTLSIAEDAKALGVDIYEHTEVVEIKKEAKFSLASKEKSFKATKLIIAAGPYTDHLVPLIYPEWKPVILPSKGSHLWFSKSLLKLQGNIVLQTKDNRILFLIDHGDKVLAGTTEVSLDPSQVKYNLTPSPEEIHYILSNINTYLKLELKESDIIGSFSGIRPLVREKNTSSTKTSRHHKIYQPVSDLVVIAGGKYTTCRVMAKDVVAALEK